jgi:hypothetical protein
MKVRRTLRNGNRSLLVNWKSSPMYDQERTGGDTRIHAHHCPLRCPFALPAPFATMGRAPMIRRSCQRPSMRIAACGACGVPLRAPPSRVRLVVACNFPVVAASRPSAPGTVKRIPTRPVSAGVRARRANEHGSCRMPCARCTEVADRKGGSRDESAQRDWRPPHAALVAYVGIARMIWIRRPTAVLCYKGE